VTPARDEPAGAVIAALTAAIPGARAGLLGSLAPGTADACSDIDVEWVVPDGRLTAGAAQTRSVLERVRPIAAVRTSPDFLHSPVRRLLFVRHRCAAVLVPPGERAGQRAGSGESRGTRAVRGRARPAGPRVRPDRRGRFGEWADDVKWLARAAVAREPGLTAPAEETIQLAGAELG
jgi:hypothetical protein